MVGTGWMDGWLIEWNENQKDKITFLKNRKKAKKQKMVAIQTRKSKRQRDKL